MLARR
jgi:hypothetical protein